MVNYITLFKAGMVIMETFSTFLAPPAERQRSFSNADSSVVRRRPSSVRPSSTFQLKAWFFKNCLIIFFFFWLFWKVRKVKFGFFFTWRQFSQKLFDNFLYLCKKLPKEGTNGLPNDGFDWITLKVIFQGPKGLKKVKFGCF